MIGEDFNTGYLNGEEMVDRYYNFGDDTDSFFFEDATSRNVMWLGRGHWAGENNYFDGLIDELRIYNRPINAEEAAAIYQQGLEELNSAE